MRNQFEVSTHKVEIGTYTAEELGLNKDQDYSQEEVVAALNAKGYTTDYLDYIVEVSPSHRPAFSRRW